MHTRPVIGRTTRPRRAHRAVSIVAALFIAFAPSSSSAALPCWLPPVDGVVVDPFRAPSCPFCAGNRGLEYRIGSNVAIRAVAAGRVTYSGMLAGTRYVVIQHANGWRATYGKLSSTTLSPGDRVVSRTIVGRASEDFYFGLRIGETYLDPAPYLGDLIGRPRLVPIDGTPGRPAPPARLRCAGTSHETPVGRSPRLRDRV